MPSDEATERYEFLSDEWLGAVKALRDEYAAEGATAPVELRANLVVTEVPFSSSDVLAHVDTSKGGLVIEQGHLAAPDLTVQVDWATAKALLVDGNPSAAMSAFMEGKIRIEGDVAKLMSLQSGIVDASTQQAARRIRALTR
ncbi:MAG TPA: SCP2 sterol-binding domain-containing protein [Acidimicrobiales bacterium]|nr:SCP2 sterol-binding domain-containing protein [Acidimicrobiales bacterium]